MYRRPGAHKAKAAPARWLARRARGLAGMVRARERERAAERERRRRRVGRRQRGHDGTRDTRYSRLLVHACLPDVITRLATLTSPSSAAVGRDCTPA